MNKCRVPETQKSKASLHNDIIDILFKHKKEIALILSDIRGLYRIDHVAINVISPAKSIVVFSSTPSVEYNLLIQELWKYDQSFFPSRFEDGSLFWWDNGYTTSCFTELKLLKEKKHHFTLGFSLVRKIQGFQIVYSFATRALERDLQTYYTNLTPNLFLLGDYGYKLIARIYEGYCGDYSPPKIENTGIQHLKEKSYLKLIINNKVPK